MARSITAVLLGCLLSGCVTGTYNYVPPSGAPSKDNFRIVSKPREAVWNQLVASLGKKFFVINNVDKSSGLVNLSYSGDPFRYVDCGSISSSVENARGPRTYRFDGASASERYESANDGHLYAVERTMALDGRINVILEAVDEGKTRVTVNARYVLERKITAHERSGQYAPAFRADQIAFNTGTVGTFPQLGSTEPLRCLPTNALESEVLNALDDK